MQWTRLAALLALVVLTGCSVDRVVTISSHPSAATVRIDGIEKGPSPLVYRFTFNGKNDEHHVELSHPGYKDAAIDVTSQTEPMINVELKQQSKHITINVLPFPGQISINGHAVTASNVSTYSTDLDFTLEGPKNWTSYKISAQRPGFQPVEKTITYTDADPTYTLTLPPMRKEMTITSTPPGAKVIFDDEPIGVTPLTYRGPDNQGVPFNIDPQNNQWNQYKLRIDKPGYDPVDTVVSWDDGKTDYVTDLRAHNKTVRISTIPGGGTVTIDGTEMKTRDDSGAVVASLAFPPINDRGDLKSYTVTASKKTAESEWEPKTMTLNWDEGKTEYSISLKEIKTTPVTLLLAEPKRTDEGWTLARQSIVTTAMKDVSEPTARQQPRKLTNLPKGSVIDSLAVSPDGASLIFTVLQSRGADDLRSQMLMIRSDGSGGVEDYSDGKSLDIHPAFTPDGKTIVFSSNRGGRRMSIWQISASGTPGITQLTNDDNNDLWPSIDSARHLFYQAFVDTRPDPRLFMTELGKTTRTDLTQGGGLQPRVSPDARPDADTLLFTNANEKTGKRDIFRLKTDGGLPENLTNTPDVDDFDPAWNQEGTKVAYVSDSGVDEEGRHNFDIWILDLSKPAQPVQLTTNGSWDDRPVWDPSGNFIYFRSNRGGEWAIWRIGVK